MYGKRTECAIAAMGRLAEVYDEGQTLISAADVADSRGLQRPFVAKVLNTLSQKGLISGSRGPGGGFTLARPPGEITLYEVFRLFEREDIHLLGALGDGITDRDPPIVRGRLTTLAEAMDHLLHYTTFDEFRRDGEDHPRDSAAGETTAPTPKKTRSRKGRRGSYRAPPI